MPVVDLHRSNFALELVQDADKNVYPCDVEPTLTFIYQKKVVTVLNNDEGFSVKSIKALCDDVCNIKKKEPCGDRYIDNKGTGFISVFRVSDAPEIHSNEFNIKFNISDGLATPDVCWFREPEDETLWNTCMVLPQKNEVIAVRDIEFVFNKGCPEVILFLHRLKCIKYINLVNWSSIVNRKEVVGDGMVNIFYGNYQKTTWFIEKFRLQADHVRQDVQTTEISMAFELEDSNNGSYYPYLRPQFAYAFLRPIHNYGLKFVIQADFILSSSMKDVDAESPWNQWLLSEFPNVFVSAELSFCSLPCFRENPARGVSIFLRYVSLGQGVYGFFSSLPHMIISKLRVSNCLLLEGDCNEWVRPCKVVRNWTQQIRSLLPDSLIREHLDVGYLNKDVVLSDSLAQALGIEECGPKFLVQVMTSLCRTDSLKSLGLTWLSSWLNYVFLMLVDESEYDVISSLSQLAFIPLFDGNYASISEGEIWLLRDEPGFEMFGRLYPSPKFRIVDPDLFSDHLENITELLYKFGVQRLSAHEVFKVQILPSICDEKVLTESTELMIEYLSFVMYHLESRCSKCRAEKEHIFSQLRNNAYISTNYGCKRPVDVPIHFSKEFGTPVDMNKLVGGTNMKWCEIDIGYLKHPVYKSTPKGTLKWRKFLQKLGVTDYESYDPITQRSNFALELVQDADKNVYPCDVEPTLTFIYQKKVVTVLNNDEGFSVESIKALCDDVCNIKKKEPSGDRYIDNKCTGFISVFCVSDAPEIHSNEFNIKFNISDGLATPVPPLDVCRFREPEDETLWNTCMVLPQKNEVIAVRDIEFVFCTSCPEVMLFLHRLKCIKYINLVNQSSIVNRKEVVGDGMVNIFYYNQKTTWFIEKFRLQVDHIRQDVQTTEISFALELEDSNNGSYYPHLRPQYVYAFLRPIHNYGLTFVIQADFILSSSMKDVDADSPWNQWLLSEFPNVFVSAELTFCSLPCFKENPAKGVSVFLSYVSLGKGISGFFSSLPHKIISKLCMSNCLLLEGDDNEWVRPCKVVRNWTEQIRSLLPDSLIREHLDVGYLNKDVVLSDSLAQALGIEECGPKFLVQVMISLCRGDSLKSLGLSWLSSWLNVLFLMLVDESKYDVISSLSQLPFIPLFDGNYASVSEGEIWLLRDEPGFEMFGKLYPSPEFRIVDPDLFSDHPENITEMLYKFGVQRLSAHEVFKEQILPSICDEKVLTESTELMIEYLSFVMYHLESRCSKCRAEKEDIFSQLRNNAYISTNYGSKRPVDVPIHFSKEFGNVVDMNKLVGGTIIKWYEINIGYLKHPVYKATPNGTLTWRKFLQKLGVTDFVQVVEVKKRAEVIKYTSPELMRLLSHVTMHGDREKSTYLLKVLDTLWDADFSNKPYKSYVIRMLHGDPWVASSMDDRLHFPKDLFHNCEVVRTVLGHRAPYTVPKVSSVKFLNDIGLKKIVTLDDALSILGVWRGSNIPLRASISQMSKFYTYLWNKMSISKLKMVKKLHSQAFIFVPHSFSSTHEAVSGSFLSPSEVYWHDSFGSIEQTKSIHPLFNKLLCNVYPGLHNFFVNECGVAENPPLLCYLQFLLRLSKGCLPAHAAKVAFQVFQKWSDGLNSGVLSCVDVDYMKKIMEEKETTILPTVQDKWVSLHESFGHIYWCGDEQLKKEFIDLSNVHFLCLGELTNEEKQILQDKVSVLFRRLGIPCLSEVVTHEVVHYGPTDSSYMISLVRWALPYAQRYIYRMHPNEYSQLKLSGFKNVNSLKIVVVDKLYQKYVIKSFGIESKERDCCCLLQDNILYATRKSDSHSLFMELSRFLLVGLPLANFLHMITTMTKSGFTEEKMELFVTNSQDLPNLPCEELQWSLASASSPEVESTTTKNLGKNSSWPPVHWKTTPGLDKTSLDAEEGLFESNGDWIIDENPASSMPLVILEDDEALNDQSDSVINKGKNKVSVPPQNVITGREGERAAFKYFSSTLSDKKVKWVNKVKESGLPYDILVEGKDKSQEYIEVKSTSMAKKDWFNISMNEWKFAVEKGESFIIARVVLSDGKLPKITTYRNPAKLLQSKHLQLAFHPSKK